MLAWTGDPRDLCRALPVLPGSALVLWVLSRGPLAQGTRLSAICVSADA